jgi:hypothetical protein
MTNQVHPFVKSATIKNDMIEITVELAHSDSGSYVEVSGSATQTGGAFANFYDVKEVPAGVSGAFPFVNVSSHPLPPNKFTKGEDATFVIRLGKVWLTVLGPEVSTSEPITQGTPAKEGATWNVLKRVSHIKDDDSSDDADAS